MKKNILVAIGIIVAVCIAILSINFVTNLNARKEKPIVDTETKDDYELIKYSIQDTKDIDLGEYQKAGVPREYVSEYEESFIKLIDIQKSDKELTRKYSLNMNGVVHEVTEKYTFTGKELQFILSIDGKELDNRKDDMMAFDISIDDDILNDSNNHLFKPEQLIVFNGNDNREYLLYEKSRPTPAYYFEYARLYDDKFRSLSLEINGKSIEEFSVGASYEIYDNMKQYDHDIGYFKKIKKSDYDSDTAKFFGIAGDKIIYIDISERTGICNKVIKANEYELKINNSKIDAILIRKYDGYHITAGTC